MFKTKAQDVTPNTVHAQRTDGHGNVVEEKTLTFDPYKDLLKDDGFSSVSCGLTATQPGSYGGKISFMVTVRCDQNEQAINIAGERAFQKVTEFCEDAVNLLGWHKP
jgi:hypothetical protein